MEDRKFKCVSNFMTEGRICREGEIYTAYVIGGGYKFVFENGEMNFTNRLFDEVMEDWIDADLLREVPNEH